MREAVHRGSASHAGAVALVALLALVLGGAGGCALTCPEQSPLANSSGGRVWLDWPSCRRLELMSHTWRRDTRDHLVVLVRLHNRSAGRYVAAVRVEFTDGQGVAEQGGTQTEEYVLAPGESAEIEWTSYSASAAKYVVEVRSGRVFQ